MKPVGGLAAAFFGVAILAACGRGNDFSSSTPVSVAPQIRLRQTSGGLTAERTHVRPAYAVLYSFSGGSGDGAAPIASLLNVHGTLYGTTYYGGANADGTVFSITPSGTETVLHSFNGSDGRFPQADLINIHGTLYGTTELGGTNDAGTVFSITPSGAETVLYSFAGGDGAWPSAGLLDVNGTLYGTTSQGGASKDCPSIGCGTVFSITMSGTETVLHSFAGRKDGAYPYARLINVNGTLYGTTISGGAFCKASYGCGTVFAIKPSGKETVLHSFGGAGDGESPYAALLDVNGTLYGTTGFGGRATACFGGGCGTVFAITPSGKETVLHNFGGGSGDGAIPYAGLINDKGTLYGTTENGGVRCQALGCGTVFSITTSGKETVLYRFPGFRGRGAHPYAGLINVKDILYGTTYDGGKNHQGTVFSLSP
jgi:uncharacterized repeat protein (TIGR03803 family)